MAGGGNALRVTRQLLLGLVAAMLITATWLGRLRATSWEEPLWVTVYPIVADDTPATRDYVARLTQQDFQPIADFFAAQAGRYGIDVDPPFRVDLGAPVTSLPPAPPASGNVLAVAAWSLRLRWWAWRAADSGDTPADIRLFLVYHDGNDAGPLPHSLGLQEGMLGVAHLFASERMRGSNRVVVAHELLHTLGATDKYDPATNQPAFPEGFAAPDRKPLYPQPAAELMAGRIALGPDQAAIPAKLSQVVVGPATAREIRWLGDPGDRERVESASRSSL